jgi:hypothetical protein
MSPILGEKLLALGFANVRPVVLILENIDGWLLSTMIESYYSGQVGHPPTEHVLVVV